MTELEKTTGIYESLPRFVSDLEALVEEQPTDERYLPSVTHEFTRGSTRFTLIITPARVATANARDCYFYPGRREQMIETVLRRMAVESNPNFISEEDTLYCDLEQLKQELQSFDNSVMPDERQIRLGLAVLADVKYELISPTAELCFRPVERINSVNEENAVYYRIQFSSVFLGIDKPFDFCFGGTLSN